MKFPYDRIGEPSDGGRTKARFLDAQLDTPYALAEPEDGVFAYKKGDWLDVEQEDQITLDAYYSLGFVGAIQRVVGSINARGLFTDRGPFISEDGFTPDSANVISYYGRGLGTVPNAVFTGYTSDFNDLPSQTYEVYINRTRNGTRFASWYSFPLQRPYVGASAVQYLTQVVRSLPMIFSLFPGVAPQFLAAGWGFNAMRQDTGRYFFGYAVDDGVGLPAFGNTITLEDQIANQFTPYVVAPGVLVALGTYLRPEYNSALRPFPIVDADCPGYTFQFSFDGGRNWELASSTDFLQEFDDTVRTLAAPDFNPDFNKAVSYLQATVQPLAGNLAMMTGVVPYAVANPDIPGTVLIKGKVKVGLVDLNARTIYSTSTLYDGPIEVADRYNNGTLVSIAGGCVIMTKPPTEADYHDDAVVPLFTPDGVSFATMPPMPQPAWLTGSIMTALNPQTLLCCMYDGEYSLYQSRDLGTTWLKRAVLSRTGNAPTKVDRANYLLDFSVVSQLRAGNLPANATPGTPWASDSRIAAPVL